MIRIPVNLDQYGQGKKVTKLCELTITNTLTSHNATRGNYIVRLFNVNGKEYRTAFIYDWPRERMSAAKLVAEAWRVIYETGEEHGKA